MPLTFDEITQREERLQQEIAERERLLGAYQLLRADAANHQSWKSTEAPVVAAVAPPATAASNGAACGVCLRACANKPARACRAQDQPSAGCAPIETRGQRQNCLVGDRADDWRLYTARYSRAAGARRLSNAACGDFSCFDAVETTRRD